jgi:hypothetical protein
MTGPIVTIYDGEVFVPLRSFRKECDARFVAGQRYSFDPDEERSHKAHAAYFAYVTECWRNLPEDQAERFPSPMALRRYALIKCGYADKREVVCANNSEAMRLAALVKSFDPYSLTMVSERAVAIWTAQSQSYKAMGKKAFLESQQAVRDFLAAMIGTAPAEVERAA